MHGFFENDALSSERAFSFCIISYSLHTLISKEESMDKIYKTGTTPGSGTYDCTNCHTKVHLGNGDTMPPCPKCTNNEFTKQ